jgi:putative membrane protein
VLVIAAASHDILAKLMYAWNLPAAAGPVAARHLGSELMYYGGTVIDVALAVVIMAQWYTVTGRALARERRTPGAGLSGRCIASSRARWRAPGRHAGRSRSR